MKKRLLTLCLTLALAISLCVPALAADYIALDMTSWSYNENDSDDLQSARNMRHGYFGARSEPVTNRSVLQIEERQLPQTEFGDLVGDLQFDYLLENRTDQTDRTLAALIFYDPDAVFTLAYTPFDPSRAYPYPGKAYFFDLTIQPGDTVVLHTARHFESEESWRSHGSHCLGSLEQPCFLINFDTQEEMEAFEAGIDFQPVPTEASRLNSKGERDDFTGWDDMYMDTTPANAQLILDLERQTMSRTDITGAAPFSEGYAHVIYRDRTHGYLDSSAKAAVSPGSYADANSFAEGKAIVTRYVEGTTPRTEESYGEMGFIDQSGTFTPFHDNGMIYVPNTAGSSWAFQEGYAFIKWGGDTPGSLYDSQGNEVSDTAEGPVKEGLLLASSDGNGWCEGPYKWGTPRDQMLSVADMTEVFYASEEKPLVSGEWNIYNINPFDDGLAWAQVLNNTGGIQDGDNRLGGFIDHSGKMVIPPQYPSIWVASQNSAFEVFQQGIACVRNVDGKYGGIDTKGNTVVPFQYDTGFVFGGDGQLARVIVDGKAGYIDQTGRMVIPAIYDAGYSASFSSDGLVRVCRGGKIGYLDAAGQTVLPFEYGKGSTDFQDGWAILKQHQAYTVTPNPLG